MCFCFLKFVKRQTKKFVKPQLFVQVKYKIQKKQYIFKNIQIDCDKKKQLYLLPILTKFILRMTKDRNNTIQRFQRLLVYRSFKYKQRKNTCRTSIENLSCMNLPCITIAYMIDHSHQNKDLLHNNNANSMNYTNIHRHMLG